MSAGLVPMPGECHPGLEPYRDGLRRALSDGLPLVCIPVIKPMTAVFRTEGDIDPIILNPVTKRTLERRKCQGPAPYVGRPFAYRWDVLVDDLGRWIAGDLEIHYIPQRPDELLPGFQDHWVPTR